uniref:Immunoglobulin V-set domain-containing protein n=1 Tax=Amphiprion percula TaxID=161767 RepID=A0A3P8U5P2_AMPPE
MSEINQIKLKINKRTSTLQENINYQRDKPFPTVYPLPVPLLCSCSSSPVQVYRTTEGGEITVRCSLPVQQRNRKFLCRDDCKNFLFDTNDPRASSGRYSIEFWDQSYFNVTIGQLSGADSGTYRCGVGREREENICRQFEIVVTGGESKTAALQSLHRNSYLQAFQ